MLNMLNCDIVIIGSYARHTVSFTFRIIPLRKIKTSLCSIQPLGLDKERETRMYKNIIFVLFILWLWRPCGAGEQSKRVRTYKGAAGVGRASGNWLQPKFLTLYILKTPRRPICNACFSFVMACTHALLAFHWSQLTLPHYLLFIAYCLHPHNACSLLVTTCVLTFLVFR